MTPYCPKPILTRSDSPKLENDKRNGLDMELPEEEYEMTVKRVRWAPTYGERSSSELTDRPATYITPRSTKQIQFDTDTPDEVRLAHELRLAVHRGGGSIDPERNSELRARLSPMQLPYSRVQRILRECELYERNQMTYILPIDYSRQTVGLICKARTDNLSDLKLRLSVILKQHRARFVNRHLFKETGIIEAVLPNKVLLSFEDFNQTLQTDALWCKATSVAIKNYQQGAVTFQCQPLDLREVKAKLRDCGYKITHSEMGHSPKKALVQLPERQMKRYKEFLEQLQQDHDVVRVYDNVRV